MNPLISIITVNLNNGPGLDTTIRSVAEQTFKEFEYIVIDGASTDGSQEVITRYAHKITSWISEKDSGIYDGMNKGISKSKGEYLLFLNSGDRLLNKNVLQKVSKHLDGNTEIVYGNLMIEEHGKLTKGTMPDEITLEQMMRDTLWHPVSFIKAELFDKYGLYDTSFRICGDYDFFFKVIIAKKASTKHMNEVISVFELKGLSSDIKNVPIIQAEKERVQNMYLSKREIEDFYNRVPELSKWQTFKKWFR